MPVETTMFEDMRQICQFVGLLGFLFYLGGFAGLQLQLLDGNDYPYTLINLLAAGFVLIGLSYEFNLASALIQISWIIIGVVGISFRLFGKRRKIAVQNAL